MKNTIKVQTKHLCINGKSGWYVLADGEPLHTEPLSSMHVAVTISSNVLGDVKRGAAVESLKW